MRTCISQFGEWDNSLDPNNYHRLSIYVLFWVKGNCCCTHESGMKSWVYNTISIIILICWNHVLKTRFHNLIEIMFWTHDFAHCVYGWLVVWTSMCVINSTLWVNLDLNFFHVIINPKYRTLGFHFSIRDGIGFRKLKNLPLYFMILILK